jgi:hypothetical protein
MRDSEEAWPVKRKFSSPPAEECRKDVLKAAGGVRVTPGLVYPARATTRAKLERIYGYVFTAVARFKKLPAFNLLDTCGDSRIILHGGVSAGAKKIHGTIRSPQAVPIGSRNAAGRGLQAGEGMGLVKSAPAG